MKNFTKRMMLTSLALAVSVSVSFAAGSFNLNSNVYNTPVGQQAPISQQIINASDWTNVTKVDKILVRDTAFQAAVKATNADINTAATLAKPTTANSFKLPTFKGKGGQANNNFTEGKMTNGVGFEYVPEGVTVNFGNGLTHSFPRGTTSVEPPRTINPGQVVGEKAKLEGLKYLGKADNTKIVDRTFDHKIGGFPEGDDYNGAFDDPNNHCVVPPRTMDFPKITDQKAKDSQGSEYGAYRIDRFDNNNKIFNGKGGNSGGGTGTDGETVDPNAGGTTTDPTIGGGDNVDPNAGGDTNVADNGNGKLKPNDFIYRRDRDLLPKGNGHWEKDPKTGFFYWVPDADTTADGTGTGGDDSGKTPGVLPKVNDYDDLIVKRDDFGEATIGEAHPMDLKNGHWERKPFTNVETGEVVGWYLVWVPNEPGDKPHFNGIDDPQNYSDDRFGNGFDADSVAGMYRYAQRENMRKRVENAGEKTKEIAPNQFAQGFAYDTADGLRIIREVYKNPARPNEVIIGRILDIQHY